MIEQEILAILADERDDGSRLNGLVDEFRGGRDARELLPLLDSEDVELVSIAAMIYAEIPEEFYDDEAILQRLRGLTQRGNAVLKMYALNALFPFLDSAMPSTRELFARLARDEDEHFREFVRGAAARLGLALD